MRSIACLIVLLVAPIACIPDAPLAPASPPTAAASAGEPPASRIRLAKPPPLPDELKGLATSANAFGLDLFGKLRAQQGNLAFSPLSISIALAMTWAGARGETAREMQRTLHIEGTVEETVARYGKLLAGYRDPALGVGLSLANRLFGEKTYGFRQAYLDLTGSAFGAPFEPVDFSGASEATRLHINAWVAGATGDRIKDLAPPGTVNSDTRLAIVNAIYFLGEWQAQFSERSTTPAPFYLTTSKSINAPTMQQKTHFRFAATDGVKILEMPYQGGALVMTFVLPDRVDGLDAVETRLSAAVLDQWVASLQSVRVSVRLPKFEVNPANSLSLNQPLVALGVRLAFNPGAADFSGLADQGRALYVSHVLHKAFVKVNEKGTEAAAATVVLIEGKRAPPPLGGEFHADHPFLFFLRDLRSGMILFVGRVADPTAR